MGKLFKNDIHPIPFSAKVWNMKLIFNTKYFVASPLHFFSLHICTKKNAYEYYKLCISWCFAKVWNLIRKSKKNSNLLIYSTRYHCIWCPEYWYTCFLNYHSCTSTCHHRFISHEFLIGMWSDYQIFPPIAFFQCILLLLGWLPVVTGKKRRCWDPTWVHSSAQPLISYAPLGRLLTSLNFYFLFYKVEK